MDFFLGGDLSCAVDGDLIKLSAEVNIIQDALLARLESRRRMGRMPRGYDVARLVDETRVLESSIERCAHLRIAIFREIEKRRPDLGSGLTLERALALESPVHPAPVSTPCDPVVAYADRV